MNVDRSRRVFLTGILLCTFLAALVRLNGKTRPGAAVIPQLSEIGHMTNMRSGHTATLLPDGTVLLAGGMVDNGMFLRSAEIYDPAKRTFAAASGQMTVARVAHVAVALRDGRVLLAGGFTGDSSTDSAEVYDPASKTFSALSARMHSPRGQFTATTLRDGTILLAGGDAADLLAVSSAELFDPATNQFVSVSDMQDRRISHTATLLPDGRVLLAGGRAGRGPALASSEIYDPATKSFVSGGNMISARYKHTAAALANGNVLLAGGSDQRDWKGTTGHAEIYDVRTRHFTAVADLQDARFKLPAEAVVLASGDVVVAGGAKSVEIFRPDRAKFQAARGMLDADYHFMTETKLGDGSVLLAGGYGDGSRATAQAWLFAGTPAGEK
jgi:Galactose oxidase, central domain